MGRILSDNRYVGVPAMRMIDQPFDMVAGADQSGHCQFAVSSPSGFSARSDSAMITEMLNYLSQKFLSHQVAAIEIDQQSKLATVIATIGHGGGKTSGPDFSRLAAKLQLDVGDADGSAITVGRSKLPESNIPVLVLKVPITPATDILIVGTRKANAADFTILDEAAARQAAAWAGGCVRLWYAFRSERIRALGLNSALDILAIAVIVLDQGGRLTAANRTAWAMLDHGDGVRISGEKLRASMLDDSARLQTAISQAASQSEAGHQTPRAHMLSIRRRGRRPLAVAVLRGGARPKGGHSVVVHAVDPEGDISKSLAPLCDLYEFTAAETRLIHLLVAGYSLSDAAARLDIASLTARTHLKRMFEKTDTHRQAALIHLVLTSVVQFSADVELVVV